MLEDLVRERLAGWPAQWERYHWPGYTYEHTLRVRSLALALGEREGANLRIIEMASLLHDICKPVGRRHAQAGAEEAERVLRGLGVRATERRRVCEAIALHCGDNQPDSAPESRCLADADLIDGNFGLVATWRFITIRAGHGTSLEETIGAMSEWLPRKDQLLGWLLTPSGREIARQRSARMRLFCEQLMEEMRRPLPSRDGMVRVAGFFHDVRGGALLEEQVEALEGNGGGADGALAVICRSLRREIAGLH